MGGTGCSLNKPRKPNLVGFHSLNRIEEIEVDVLMQINYCIAISYVNIENTPVNFNSPSFY